MITEIALIILCTVHVIFVVSLCVVFFKVRKYAKCLCSHVEKTSVETIQLLTSLNELVRSDLHAVSNGATDLIHQSSQLVSDLKYKTKSLNFLFKPFDYLTSGMDKPAGQKKAIPEIMKWVSRGFVLVKLTKELAKKYGK